MDARVSLQSAEEKPKTPGYRVGHGRFSYTRRPQVCALAAALSLPPTLSHTLPVSMLTGQLNEIADITAQTLR